MYFNLRLSKPILRQERVVPKGKPLLRQERAVPKGKPLLRQERVVPKGKPDSGTAATGDLSGSRTDVSDKPDSYSKKGTDPSPEKPGTGDSSSPSGMEMGKILGITFTVVAVVLAVCGAVFFLRQRRSKAVLQP